MTPARKKALQWFHDRGEVSPLEFWPNGDIKDGPSRIMMKNMADDGQLNFCQNEGLYSLTDKGRQALHGDDV